MRPNTSPFNLIWTKPRPGNLAGFPIKYLYFNQSVTLPIKRKKQRSITLDQIPKERLCGKISTAIIIATFSATMFKGQNSLCKAGISGGGARILQDVLKAQTMQSVEEGIFLSLGERVLVDSSGLLGLARLLSRTEPILIWVVGTNCTWAYRKLVTGTMKPFETT